MTNETCRGGSVLSRTCCHLFGTKRILESVFSLKRRSLRNKRSLLRIPVKVLRTRKTSSNVDVSFRRSSDIFLKILRKEKKRTREIETDRTLTDNEETKNKKIKTKLSTWRYFLKYYQMFHYFYYSVTLT